MTLRELVDQLLREGTDRGLLDNPVFTTGHDASDGCVVPVAGIEVRAYRQGALDQLRDGAPSGTLIEPREGLVVDLEYR